VIHIGPPKTGTTYIQSWVHGNAPRLLSYGWAWPRLKDGTWLDFKDVNPWPSALCGKVMSRVAGPLGEYVDFVADRAKADTLVAKIRALIQHAAAAAPNVIVSAEGFAVRCCGECKRALRRMLAEAGIESATVLAMLRTPLIHWARSNYNQWYKAETRVALALADPQLFSSMVEGMLRWLREFFFELREWRAAGFETQVEMM
jgi:hypothetical protein